jgi:DNA-binding FadR family transcriptional regulator
MMNSIQPLVDHSREVIFIGAEGIARSNLAHRKILDAIATGDANRAREAVMEHLDSFRRRAEEAMGNLDRTTIPASAAWLNRKPSTLRQLLERGDEDGHT